MTGREHDIAEAVNGGRGPQIEHEEGAPSGAPESSSAAQEKPQQSVPTGEPEAPVGPVDSSESGAVAPPAGGAVGATAAGAAGAGPAASAGSTGAAGAATAAAAAGAAGADGAPGEEARDHERQLEHDLEELTAKAEKADEYLELAQRTRADFENYRKRAAREAAVAQERGIAKLAKELLPAVDNLDRALEAAQGAVANPDGGGDAVAPAGPDNGSTLIDGIKLVHNEVINALARAGIERFSPEGELFDPQQHEAIAQQPVEGKASGTVVEVYQRGYRLGEVVIRPARVVVAA